MNNVKCSAAASTSQSLGLSGVRNARELGGYPAAGGKVIRRGLLLRTGRLNKATQEDVDKLVTSYHVGTIIDFRSQMERESDPNPKLGDAESFSITILDEEFMQAKTREMGFSRPDNTVSAAEMLRRFIKAGLVSDQMYIDFLSTECGQAGYRKFFQCILSAPEDRAVLWHCTSGKDRTGVASMLLLSLLGADEDLILRDYMLTNEFNAETIAAQRMELIREGAEAELLEDMLTVRYAVRQSHMESAMSFLKTEYGSVINYIESVLGVPSDCVKELRSRYLE